MHKLAWKAKPGLAANRQLVADYTMETRLVVAKQRRMDRQKDLGVILWGDTLQRGL
jgi:hypothetical protein